MFTLNFKKRVAKLTCLVFLLSAFSAPLSAFAQENGSAPAPSAESAAPAESSPAPAADSGYAPESVSESAASAGESSDTAETSVPATEAETSATPAPTTDPQNSQDPIEGPIEGPIMEPVVEPIVEPIEEPASEPQIPADESDDADESSGPTTPPAPLSGGVSPAPEDSLGESPEATDETEDESQPTNDEFLKDDKPFIPVQKLEIEENDDVSRDSAQMLNLDYAPGEVIVKFREEAVDLKSFGGRSRVAEFAREKNLRKKEHLKNANLSVFQTKKNESVESLIARLQQDPEVEYAEPNYIYRYSVITTNDTLKDDLWGLDNTGQTVKGVPGTADADIDAAEAWALSEGGPAIVAVLDSGVAYRHPDLINQMWDGTNCKDENGNALGGCIHGYDYMANDKDPLPTSEIQDGNDVTAHGTHIAGTIAAEKNNGKGIIGVAPKAKIMALKAGNTISIVKATDFARHNGAKIINASLGNPNFSQAVYDAIARFRNSGGLFVTSAGNEGVNNDATPQYPCAYDLDNIICVAATDQDDNITSFSNYGVSTVDVGAPGSNIASAALLNNSYSKVMSTSFSSMPSGFVATGDMGIASFAGFLIGDTTFNGYDDTSYKDDQPYNTTTTSTTYNLAGAQTAEIALTVACDTEYNANSGDYMALEISSDGVNFTELKRFDEYSLNADVPGYDPAPFSVLFHDLNVGIPSNDLVNGFQFRFRWVTDGDGEKGTGIGCLIDGMGIYTYANVDGSDEGYDYWAGTSMATPHVAGLAALIWGGQPALSLTQIKDLILNSGDSLPSLAGKTTTGKRINAFNAMNYFQPHVGYTTDESIQADQVHQQTDGSGTLVIGFKIKDSVGGLSATLNSFEYSLDEGVTWNAPANGDSSGSLSANWNNNGYQTAVDYSAATSYSFSWNTKHPDVNLDNTLGAIQVRFKANDGFMNSPQAVSEKISFDNKKTDIVITAPTLKSNGAIADTTIRVADDSAPLQKVIVSNVSTVAVSDFTCTDLNVMPVDCAVKILTSGDLTITAVDNFGNENSQTQAGYEIDNPLPVLNEITPVPVLTNNASPKYTFGSTKAGVIAYGGVCSSATANATAGDNTILFNPLTDGTYSDCTITVTDADGNVSAPLNISSFTVDLTNPVILITAPAKTSTGPIAGVALKATDNHALESDKIMIAENSTTTVSDWNCVQTNDTQIDCMVTVTSSGDLVIVATDKAGNSAQATEANFAIGSLPQNPVTETPPADTGGGGGYINGPILPGQKINPPTSTYLLEKTASYTRSYTEAIKLAKSMVKESDGMKSAQLTEKNSEIILWSGKTGIGSMTIPQNTTVTGTKKWNRQILPPENKPVRLISTEGEEIKGSDAKLYREDALVLIQAGSETSPLTFSNPVTFAIQLDFPDGALMQILYSDEHNTWNLLGQASVNDGKVEFQTSHCSYYVLSGKTDFTQGNASADTEQMTVFDLGLSADETGESLIPDNPDTALTETAKTESVNLKTLKPIRHFLFTGKKGEEVEALQQVLREDGFYLGAIDGIYDETTESAVLAYQKSLGWKGSGAVGKWTLVKINRRIAELSAVRTD